VAQGIDAAGIQRVKDSCTARLQSDAAHSGIVTGTVVPRPFTVASIAFSGNPVQSTGASGLPSYDILMKITTKLVDGPAQESVRVCRVYDSDSHVDWLPAG
jgi:glycine/serine hydroxymethyltransferase